MKKRVDSIALLFCVLRNKNYINQYRFQLVLEDFIDPVILQKTVDLLIPSYPLLFAKLSKNLFWYDLESLDTLKIEEDPGVFKAMDYRSVYDQAIHILYKENKVSIEAFHALSDGSGMMTMIKELVSIYESLKQNKEVIPVNHCLEELEDAYSLIPSYKKVHVRKRNHSFKFSKRRNHFNTMHYHLPLNQIKALAKEKQCTINEMILALFYKTIRSLDSHKKIIFSSPINLRNHFPSSTLRNFTLNAQLVLDDDEHIISQIQKEMRIQNTKEYLGYENNRIQTVYNFPFVKYCPLWIKEPFIRFGYSLMGEKSCMTITNLGLQSFGLSVRDADVFISPRLSTPINCAIISINGKLRMNISHDGSTPELFLALENELKQLNLEYTKRDA